MISEDELQLLLTLNGNNRLPHLEEEIFASEVHAIIYMRAIVEEGCRHSSLASMVYEYARWTLLERWVSAEQVFNRSEETYWCHHYCAYFKLSQLTKP